jgi:hypothetical protein
MNDENINRSVSNILVVDDVSENLKLLLNMLHRPDIKFDLQIIYIISLLKNELV